MALTSKGVPAITAAATILMLPAFLAGHIVGHNSPFDVSWSAGFAEQVFSGVLYPRWLPDMSHGTGSPVFYFYGPLPFYLATPFHLVAGPRMAIILGSWLMLALSGLAFHRLASAFVRPGPALFAAILYMAMPYHLAIDVWYRAAYGEQAAFIFIPLCLVCALSLDRGWGWAFGLAASHAGLIFSHLPSALLFSPFLVAACLWPARVAPSIVIARAVAAALLSAGLASVYIVPALSLQDMIHSDYWGTYRPGENLLFSSSMESVRKHLSSIVMVVAPVATLATWASMKTGRWRAAAPWMIAALAALFLVTPVSAWLWNLFPMMDKIQFPWRVLTVLDVAICMIIAIATETRLRIWIAPVATVAVLIATLPIVLGKALYQAPDAKKEDWLIEARAGTPEYLPACHPRWNPDSIFRGSSIPVINEDLRQAGADVSGLPPVYYFPFLRVIVDGEPIKVTCDRQTGFIATDEPLDARDIQIRPVMTTPERIGLFMTIVSALLLLAGLVLVSRGQRRSWGKLVAGCAEMDDGQTRYAGDMAE